MIIGVPSGGGGTSQRSRWAIWQLSSVEDPYLYPGTNVLRNKLGIRNAAKFDAAERGHALTRYVEGTPAGDFDLRHLRAIHRHLFQDVYDWAGEIRTIDFGKGGRQFLRRQFIEAEMEHVHRRLITRDYLKGMTREPFAAAAARIVGDVNHIHPFREGNGRTQLAYLKELGRQAGQQIDLVRLDRWEWIEASQKAHEGDYGPMGREILKLVSG